MKKLLLWILILILLLTFYNATICGAKNGLLLWYQTLVPSLMPFLLITNALSETGAYHSICTLSNRFSFNRIYELTAILLGNLCGYPIGGKIINDFIKYGYLSPTQGNQLLSFASQASPMFLIGFVHTHILKKELPLSVFLLSIYLPVLILYPLRTPAQDKKQIQNLSSTQKNFRICDTFIHAVHVMVMIGLYVMIFSIILEITLPYCHSIPQKLFFSFFEITNGLNLIKTLPLNLPIKTSIICALSSFGGFCSAFQIQTVLEYKEINMKKYLIDKIILSTGTFLIIRGYYVILELFIH